MMTIADEIQRIFRVADVEGLIADGAPDDEYDSEAVEVAEALAALKKEDLTEKNISAIISLVWARSFNRGEEEIEMRLPAFREIARKILGAS